MQFPLSDWCEKWYGESKWPYDGPPPVNESLELRIAEVLEALRQAVATADPDGLRVEATESEWAPIETLRSEIERSLDGTPPSGTVAIARNRVPEVLNLVGAVRLQVQERLALEAKRITDGLEGYDKPDDAEGDEWNPVTTAVQGIHDALTVPALKKAIIEEADRQFLALPGIADQARNVIKARLERWKLEAETIEESLKGYEKLPEDAEEADWQTVKETCATVRSGLNVPKLSTEILRVATELRDAIPSKIETANGIIKIRRDKANELLAEVTTGKLGTDPEGVLPGQKKKLATSREDARKKAIVKPMTPAALQAAQDARDLLEKSHLEIAEEILELGGAQTISELQAAFGGADRVEAMQEAFGLPKPGDLKKLVEDFGGKDKIKSLLATFKNPKQLATVATNLGGAKCVDALLTDGCGGKPAELKKLHDVFSGNFTKLNGLLEKGGLKNQPKALAALVKTAAKPADFKILCDTFTKDEDLENLSKLLTEGGLGAKPEVLAETLNSGVPGDNMRTKTQGLQAWAKTMQPALPKLNTLVSEKDGLGDNPKVLAGLMKVGCKGDAKNFKALLDGCDATALGQINALVAKGGFGTSPNVKPECLGHLFATGCGGKPADLVKLCAQLQPGDHTNLKALMGDGGLGQEPEVLAHLYKTGCPNKSDGGNSDFQKFGTAFGGNPADLKGLLTTGGFAQKTTKPAVKPEALAQLLGTGCDGDATKLKALATHPGALPKVKGLLEGGGLGFRPEALGHAYKLGCNQDPAKLANLHDQFNGSGGTKLGRLGDLMEKANFKGRPEMLGEVLGTGCGGDAKNLKDMAVAFAGNKIPHLKELVDEWGPESGNAIKTLTDPRHLNGNFGSIQSKFSATLRQKYPQGYEVGRKNLIKKAPKFTRKAITVGTLNSGLTTPLAFDPADVDPFSGTDPNHLLAHVCERHVPSHFAFKNPVAGFGAIKHSNTQFPMGTEPKDIAALIKAAIKSPNGKAAIQSFKLIVDTYETNLRNYELKRNYDRWLNHYNLYQDKLDYDYWWFNQGGRLWSTYLHVGHANWRGNIPWDAGDPPCDYPPHWAQVDPGPAPNPDPGPSPHPGARPKPSTTFDYNGMKFKVGGSFKDGQWKIGQFFPVAPTDGTPTTLQEFPEYAMETLRDAMT